MKTQIKDLGTKKKRKAREGEGEKGNHKAPYLEWSETPLPLVKTAELL